MERKLIIILTKGRGITGEYFRIIDKREKIEGEREDRVGLIDSWMNYHQSDDERGNDYLGLDRK